MALTGRLCWLCRTSKYYKNVHRFSSTWKKRQIKQEEIKETVYQFTVENVNQLQERIYVWGFAATGALGIKSYLRPQKKQTAISSMNRPAQMKFFESNNMKVQNVACGYGFTLFLVDRMKGCHEILGTGINTDSQIGYHPVDNKSERYLDYVIEPAKINLPLLHSSKTKILNMDGGRAHTVLLTDKEGVFSFGNNAYGQCGRSIIENEKYSGNPTVYKIKELPDDVIEVICGQDHTLFLTKAGVVYSCGLGSDGQTGLGHYQSIGRPSQVKGDLEGERIVQIACSADCVLALSDKGDVFGWGNSEYNQLALITDHTQVNIPKRIQVSASCGKIVKVASGGSICGFLNENGEVFTWGYGILGLGPNVQATTIPTKLPSPLFGANEIDAGKKVVNLKCGVYSFAAITNRGDLYMWGKNKFGNLGFANKKDQFFPWRVCVPSEVLDVWCGVDHTVVRCVSFS